MLVGLANCGPDLVVDNQSFLEAFICQKDVSRHPGSPGQCNDQWPNQLVEALVDIDTGSSDIATSGLLELEVELGKVPAFLGSCPWDASKHLRFGPGVYPLAEVPVRTEAQTLQITEVIFKMRWAMGLPAS